MDYTGQTFGRAVVLRRTEDRTSSRNAVYELRCGCGAIFTRGGTSLSNARRKGSALGCDACVRAFVSGRARAHTLKIMQQRRFAKRSAS